jgi:hypothetical protein
MNAGRITVLGYVVMYLVVPMIGISTLGRPDYSIYHYSGLGVAAALTVLLVLFACFTPLFAIASEVGSRHTADGLAVIAYRALQRFILPLSLALVAVFVVLYPPSLANYRYLSTGIAGLGTSFFLAVALKSVCTVVLVWLLSEYVRYPEQGGWQRRLSVLVLSAMLIYGASGTGDVFSASFFVLLFVSPKWFVQFATINRGTSLLARRNMFTYLGILVIAVQAIASISVGENIKYGGTVGQSIIASSTETVTTVLDAFGFQGTSAAPKTAQEATRPAGLPATDSALSGAISSTGAWFVVRILEGTASHYYSLLQFFDGHAQARLEQFSLPMSYPIDAVRYRLKVLIGATETERPDIQSISKLNFDVLSLKPSATQGTSPGAVASFAYLLPLPLALVAAILYLALIAGFTNQLFQSKKRKFSLIGGLVIMIQLQVLFQSPLDFTLLIDNSFVFLVAFLLLSHVTGRGYASTQSAASHAIVPTR